MYDECDKLRRLRVYTTAVEAMLTTTARKLYKKWYTYQNIQAECKPLALMFHMESPEKSIEFLDAVKHCRFSKLNHYLLNTEMGRAYFPGMKLDNLRIICTLYDRQNP
jgi:hypothetical protein